MMGKFLDSKENIKNGKAAFIIPFWSEGKAHRQRYLQQAIDSIYAQTDGKWTIYITDDCSPSEEAKQYLSELQEKDPSRIRIFYSTQNNGCGYARVQSMEFAYKDNCPFICWLDSDDVSSKYRVEETRRIFLNDPEASVVYSTFKAIDEDDNLIPEEELTASLKEIIDANSSNPLQGYDIWIPMATETGYINIPSATNVKTSLAVKFPFPRVPFCEDLITWFKYSASGAKFIYSPKIYSLYRVPRNQSGSESRERAGGKVAFYKAKCEWDTKGIDAAIRLAAARGVISNEKGKEIKARFLVRLAETMQKENQHYLAQVCIKLAGEISNGKSAPLFR